MEENKELLEVEKRLKVEKSRRMFERYQTIRLSLLGQNNQQIANTIGRSDRTVRTYLPSFKTSSLSGLQIRSAPV